MFGTRRVAQGILRLEKKEKEKDTVTALAEYDTLFAFVVDLKNKYVRP